MAIVMSSHSQADGGQSKPSKDDVSAERHALRKNFKEILGSRLTSFGWQVKRGRAGVEFATGPVITYPLTNWDGFFSEGSLLHLSLGMTERRMGVRVVPDMEYHEMVDRFLTKYARRLEQIALPEVSGAGMGRELWRIDGGWKDPIDLGARAARIGYLTEQWVFAFAGLGDDLCLMEEKREAKEIAYWVRRGWKESEVPGLRK